MTVKSKGTKSNNDEFEFKMKEALRQRDEAQYELKCVAKELLHVKNKCIDIEKNKNRTDRKSVV